MANEQGAAALHADDDHQRSVRYSRATGTAVTGVVHQAQDEELLVEGRVNPVKVRESHVLRLAIELGTPLVLARLREIQAEHGGE